MIGLVVTGHGHFADGIHTSAQMIAGENEYVRYINFEEGMTPEQLAEKFNAAFDEFRTCDGVVVLSDLPGGSPFKTAVECKYARPDQKSGNNFSHDLRRLQFCRKKSAQFSRNQNNRQIFKNFISFHLSSPLCNMIKA